MKAKETKKKFYYAVLTGCLLVIVGVSAVIYNSTLPKPAQEITITTRSKLTTTTVSEQNELANVPATGIPKPTTTQITTAQVNESEKAFSGDFAAPTDGKATADFSGGEMVKNNTMGDWRVHNGTDFAAGSSDSVYAVQNGSVSSIDKDDMWGVTLTLTCPDGLSVKYCGLDDSVKLKKGDAVKKGEKIGKIGFLPIESADDMHIHIETTVDGNTVNPLEALNLI
ncbi:MAG: M23 family metallopeptidase [Clostridia bacterium]|nr:M23 family metallopeptidase [Clostridia bacterium]